MFMKVRSRGCNTQVDVGHRAEDRHTHTQTHPHRRASERLRGRRPVAQTHKSRLHRKICPISQMNVCLVNKRIGQSLVKDVSEITNRYFKRRNISAITQTCLTMNCLLVFIFFWDCYCSRCLKRSHFFLCTHFTKSSFITSQIIITFCS